MTWFTELPTYLKWCVGVQGICFAGMVYAWVKMLLILLRMRRAEKEGEGTPTIRERGDK